MPLQTLTRDELSQLWCASDVRLYTLPKDLRLRLSLTDSLTNITCEGSMQTNLTAEDKLSEGRTYKNNE